MVVVLQARDDAATVGDDRAIRRGVYDGASPGAPRTVEESRPHAIVRSGRIRNGHDRIRHFAKLLALDDDDGSAKRPLSIYRLALAEKLNSPSVQFVQRLEQVLGAPCKAVD